MPRSAFELPHLRPLMIHDFPLRPDLTVRFYLPERLTVADAERLARIVRALAVDPGSDDGR